MPLLLTWFHLYFKITILQDTYSKTSGKPSKRHNSGSTIQKYARGMNREAHLCNLPRQNIDVGEAQAQPPAHIAKAVAR
jgi:hypothetical protein